jgi:hypothetical protein
MRRVAAVIVALAFAGGCTAPASPRADGFGPAARATPTAVPTVTPEFDAVSARATVRFLAGDIGPREATSPAYRRAATHVERRLQAMGYDVRLQRFRVPAGVSWGVPVPAGETWNIVATPRGLAPRAPHRLVGAHLDTVPQAPGAEDNASGVAVLLELARLAAAHRPAVPVVFVAFAAEEPRGPGDARHHYGSRSYVAGLDPAARQAIRGMVSLDRVGIGEVVPVCTGGRAPRTVQRALLEVARRTGIPARACANRSSDHWSFEKAGIPAARLGGEPYPQYHSPRDRAGIVSADQLDRVGRLAWAWLSG